MKPKLSYFIPIVIVLTSFIQVGFAKSGIDTFLEHIILNETYCVDRYEEDRVYLKSENLTTTDEGIFLDLNGFEAIQIPSLQSDHSGCSVIMPLNDKIIEVLNKCPQCGRRYFVRCKNPDCPSNKK